MEDAARITEARKPYDWARIRARYGRRSGFEALYGEDQAEIDSVYERWYAAFQPDGPAECHVVDEIISDLFHLRRCRRALAAVEARLIKKARERFGAGQRRELARLQKQLRCDAAAAVAELKQSALGCRWLIECFEALGQFLESGRAEDHGKQRRLSLPGDVHQRRALAYFAAAGSMGPGIDPNSAGAPAAGSLARLRAVMDWELPRLRVLFEWLQAEGNGPTEEAAIDAALASDEDRTRVLRTQRYHQRSFNQMYRMLLERHGGPPPPDLSGLPMPPETGKPARRRKK
jgi:hypothetical protein